MKVKHTKNHSKLKRSIAIVATFIGLGLATQLQAGYHGYYGCRNCGGVTQLRVYDVTVKVGEDDRYVYFAIEQPTTASTSVAAVA